MSERGSGPAAAAGRVGAKRWHGVERSMYEWFPIVDYEACTGCGLCLLTCGNGAFRWSSSGNVPVVADPGSCVLGCTTCGKLCPEGAIKFPDDPKLFLEKVIRENRIYPQVRRELDERLRKYPDHRVTGGWKMTENDNGFGAWHGVDRRSIDWHPIVDEDRCVGCGLCVVTCSERRNVFGFDPERRKAVVIYPENCMVGCDNCRAGCLWDAISFPDPSPLRELARSLVENGRIGEELEIRLKTDPATVLT